MVRSLNEEVYFSANFISTRFVLRAWGLVYDDDGDYAIKMESLTIR